MSRFVPSWVRRPSPASVTPHTMPGAPVTPAPHAAASSAGRANEPLPIEALKVLRSHDATCRGCATCQTAFDEVVAYGRAHPQHADEMLQRLGEGEWRTPVRRAPQAPDTVGQVSTGANLATAVPAAYSPPTPPDLVAAIRAARADDDDTSSRNARDVALRALFTSSPITRETPAGASTTVPSPSPDSLVAAVRAARGGR